MDNDDALIGTIYSRREALLVAARAGFGFAAGGGLLQAAMAEFTPAQSHQVNLIASPELTEGPFFVDKQLYRSNLIAGTKRESVVSGLPLDLQVKVLKLTSNGHVPFIGAQIDVWHADVAGVYSDENNPMNHENTLSQQWLRGYQLTDSKGAVAFQTIFPGWYEGRTPHIHFKIRKHSGTANKTAEFTSQFFFNEHDQNAIYSQQPYAARGRGNVDNANDNVYSVKQIDGSVAGSHMLLDLKPNGSGHSATFVVVLTDKNFNTNVHHGGPGGPGGPGFGPPPDWDLF